MRDDRSWRVMVLGGLMLVGHQVVTPAAPRAGAWTVRSGSVRVVCPLTVGGSFDARTSVLEGSFPTEAPAGGAGEFVVDLNTLDTGIGLRNAHLRDTYLETGRGPAFARAVLSGITVSGVDAASRGGKGTFSGQLLLHGETRTVTGDVELRRRGTSVRVSAAFDVSLAEFNIPPPRYLGIGVRDRVTVHVDFEALAQ